MSIITGQVAVVTSNKYGFGMKIQGRDNWFNSKYEIKAQKGDVVEFEDMDKGYINSLKITGAAAPADTGSSSAPAASGGYDQRQVSIVRQNSVTNANALLSVRKPKGYTVEELLSTAREIFSYSIGTKEEVVSDDDLEQAAALKALAEGSA